MPTLFILIDGGTREPREQADHPAPHAGAVDEDEQGREQHEQHAGEHVPERRGDGQRAAQDHAGVALHGVHALRVRVGQLRLGQLQGPVGEVVADVRVARHRLGAEGFVLADDLRGDEVDERADRHDDADLGDRDGEPLGHVVALHPVRDGHQQGREDDGEQERDDHVLQLDDEPAEDPEHAEDEEEAPRPRARDDHAGRDRPGDGLGDGRDGVDVGLGAALRRRDGSRGARAGSLAEDHARSLGRASRAAARGGGARSARRTAVGGRG
jgi:hypothetical protein